MNTQPLLGILRKQDLAVTSAKQEHKPAEVTAQLPDVTGPASNEAAQRLAKSITVGGKPVVQELKQLGKLGR